MRLPANILETARFWASALQFDSVTRSEVRSLLHSKNYEEILDRFHRDLEFGTGGLRGIVGAGTCRMNLYNVRKATTALARHLQKSYKHCVLKVAISYDSRVHSKEFAQATAEVLAAHGIIAVITKDMRPTPVLSFMVRHFACQAGVCITASHNPSEYNGYKVYGENGGQIVSPQDRCIIGEYNQIKKNAKLIHILFADGLSRKLIQEVGGELDEAYLKNLTDLPFVEKSNKKKLKVVYSPLHGAGYSIVPRALRSFGYKDLVVVPEQAVPDGRFPTVESPNPENTDTLALSLDYAKKHEADLVLVTDPDADRLAVAYKDNTGWNHINGNQLICLLGDYVLSTLRKKGCLSSSNYVVKTIVTTELFRKIALSYGVDCEDTLTGFKWIADLIARYEKDPKTCNKNFICGGEESYGFLAGTFVRDKDAIIACVLACEMVAYHKKRGVTLTEALDELYLRHGFFAESLRSYTLAGHKGPEQIKILMNQVREHTPLCVSNKNIDFILDYLEERRRCFTTRETTVISSRFPLENTLQLSFKDKTMITLRPSGTEPKLKIYFSIRKNPPNSKKALVQLKKDALQELEEVESSFCKITEKMISLKK